MVLSSLKKLVFSAHFLFILGLFIFMCLPLSWPVVFPPEFWIKQGFFFFLYVGLFYLNLLLSVPGLLFRGKSGWFATAIFLSLILILLFNAWLDRWLNLPLLMEQITLAKHAGSSDPKVPIAEFGLVIIALVIFGISTIIPVAQKIQADRFREQSLEKEKTIAELSFLKTQINPHFFFNVLHTIYALIETDTPLAKDSVYTLSHMMRYVLYETGNDITTLEKEITFVQDYIKLMKLRLNSDTQIILDMPHHLENIQVAPMIFLPFIENAFKHGISSTQPSYIYISMKQAGDTIAIEVRNSVFAEKAEHLEESNGIGLVNTRRRLDLVYPGKHELLAEQNNKTNEYLVQLKLNLK